MESDKIVHIDSPLFNATEQLFSWIGNTNSTGITIDDTAQTINFNNNYSFPFADGAAGQVLGTDGSGQLGGNQFLAAVVKLRSTKRKQS